MSFKRNRTFLTRIMSMIKTIMEELKPLYISIRRFARSWIDREEFTIRDAWLRNLPKHILPPKSFDICDKLVAAFLENLRGYVDLA